MGQAISLVEALNRITQVREPGASGISPFFFVIGSGVSYPTVPLPGDLIEFCKERAYKWNSELVAPADLPLDQEYTFWLDKAFGDADRRQEFLREKFENKPISAANQRLAHLLVDNKLTNLVITTNLDDCLSRALSLFNASFHICDHPALVDRVRTDLEEVQIVHVHGTFKYFDCCNTADEIEDRAENTLINRLLTGVLLNRTPLILGYGGWENDVVMSNLRQRIEGVTLGHNIYWFCYKCEDLSSLPEWLTGHRNVFFVVPEEKGKVSSSKIEEEEAVITDGTAELAASRVLDGFLDRYKPKPLPLTTDPLKFFIEYLENSLFYETNGFTNRDTYYIGNVIERIRRAKEHEGKDLLEEVRDAIRGARYRDAILTAGNVDSAQLDDPLRSELAEMMWRACVEYFDDTEEAREKKLAGYDLVIEFSQGGQDMEVQVRIAKALFNKGVILGNMGQSDDEIKLYEEVIDNFGNSDEPVIREVVANALFNKGVVLSERNMTNEAKSEFDEVLSRSEGTEDPGYKEKAAKSLINIGNLDKGDAGIESYDKVIREFGGENESKLRQITVEARFNKAAAIAELGREEKAIEEFNEVINRFEQYEDPGIREIVLSASLNKGIIYLQSDRPAEARECFSEVLELFKEPATELSKINRITAMAGLGMFNSAGTALVETLENGSLGSYTDDFLADLESIGSLAAVPEDFHDFLMHVNELLGRSAAGRLLTK